MNTYYFYNRGGKGSAVRLKEGLGEEGSVKRAPGTRVPSGVLVHRTSIPTAEAGLQVYPRLLCWGPLEGLPCPHALCRAHAECWPSLAEEGFLGWGVLEGIPSPPLFPALLWICFGLRGAG